MSHLTKSQRIRVMLNIGMSNREIAARIGCLTEYVRAVKQRANGADYHKKYEAKVSAAGDREQARNAGSEAYRAARAAGRACDRASDAYSRAYTRVLRATGSAAIFQK